MHSDVSFVTNLSFREQITMTPKQRGLLDWPELQLSYKNKIIGFDFASADGERGVAFRVERSGLVAVRAIRAEAQGICSGSPVELQRLADTEG